MSITSYFDDELEFRKLKKKEKRKFLNYLTEYLIEYRSSLGLSKNITFGVEIEYESLCKIDLGESSIFEWHTSKDSTLICGEEIKSPVLKDTDSDWQDLFSICSLLKEYNVSTFGNCGGHIHFGKMVFNNNYEYFINFLKLIMLYEPILFYFGYGDKLVPRRHINTYAPPIASRLYEMRKKIFRCRSLGQVLDTIPYSEKHQSICFKNLDFDCCYDFYNTIEFRFPNSSSEEVVWQNNINVLGKLLMYACSEEFDKNLVDYRLFIMNKFRYDKNTYESIQMDLAFEFADLIFDNYLDKINFFKQYFKLYRDDNNRVYARKFVKSVTI